MENQKECRCYCGNEAEEEHTCPFKEEIYDDHESLCNCCLECIGNCAMDI